MIVVVLFVCPVLDTVPVPSTSRSLLGPLVSRGSDRDFFSQLIRFLGLTLDIVLG